MPADGPEIPRIVPLEEQVYESAQHEPEYHGEVRHREVRPHPLDGYERAPEDDGAPRREQGYQLERVVLVREVPRDGRLGREVRVGDECGFEGFVNFFHDGGCGCGGR